MLEPPDLAEDRIVASVRLHYGLQLTTLAFLSLGLDVMAWAYRASTADAATYFLKLRRGVASEAGLRVPRYLADHGVAHIVAPVPTRAGPLSCDVDGFTLTLYPFINGITGAEHGLHEQHWVTYGAALREIHDVPVAPELALDLTRESFTLTQLFQRLRQSRWSDVDKALEAHSAWQTFTDPSTRELAAFWQDRRAEIQALVDRFEALGRQLRASNPPLVVCHNDVHARNVLIDTEERFWIVDWDETLLAPKECDLMFGVGGLGGELVGPREAAWFLRGYGSTAIDPAALAYYRHARALGDIGANAEQLLLMPTASEAARRNALQRMLLLFAPGNIVSLAGGSERFDT